MGMCNKPGLRREAEYSQWRRYRLWISWIEVCSSLAMVLARSEYGSGPVSKKQNCEAPVKPTKLCSKRAANYLQWRKFTLLKPSNENCSSLAMECGCGFAVKRSTRLNVGRKILKMEYLYAVNIYLRVCIETRIEQLIGCRGTIKCCS
ncbi:hypothetical protein Syun_017385 [Stephania yunnanensis]|uniref:Uncharacterized protein n=1 Tax=Stephania yunnanensis TaxID=152371 RepID=A0AAP0P307_9MAGN